MDSSTNLVDFTGRRTDWLAINRDLDINVYLFKLWSIYRFDTTDLGGGLDNWSIGAGVNAQSAISAGNDDARVRQGGFYTVAAQIGCRINRNVSLTLTGNIAVDY